MEQSEPFYHQLKQLRVAQGIQLADISAHTRISPKFLEAIEDGDFDILPMTYIRLFLRSYCNFIGSDFEETLKELEEFTGEARRNDLPSYGDVPPGSSTEAPLKAAGSEDRRTPIRLRQDLLTGTAIIIFLVLLTVFARRVYQEPAGDTGGNQAVTNLPAPPQNQPPLGTASRPLGGDGSQPVVPFESTMEFPDELFSADRLVAHIREQVRLTPPVRLTLMARDNLVIQPIRGGVAGTSFNMTVAKAQIWTVDQVLLLRTTGIHLLRGDLNGVPINFGQATGLGTLRITPGGVYEVSGYLSDE